MVTELLRKYIWLVQTFIRAGERGLSLEEISDRWEGRFDSPYSRRTFNNHREAVEEVFGIKIECNRSTNRYFVAYSEDVADENAETAWLINTFTVNNMLSLGRERLSGRVSVEDIPSGHRHLTSVLEAMTDGHEIEIAYQKYTSSRESRYTLRPYAVKEFAKRWYIIGHCIERNAVRVYGIDRVKRLEVTDRTFRMPAGFDVDELFATSFGIYLPEGPGQTILFRTSPTEARFLRDLPIHASQKELRGREKQEAADKWGDGEDVIFSIFVCPNDNLVMEFCKYGSRIEVLEPEGVRNAVARQLKDAAGLYEQQ
ncbi:MAG: WYL domain-containing protein [Bacteroidales bacterium]|nr:WYL domain-containing protein [Bacteroidales bacterium]